MAPPFTAASVRRPTPVGARKALPSPVLVTLLLATSLTALLTGRLAAAQTDTDKTTPGNACKAVLQAGVFNQFQTTTPGAVTFSDVQGAACLDYSSYTQMGYQYDAPRLAGLSVPLNLAAKAFNWGGAGSSSGTGSVLVDPTQFNDAVAKAAAYRATACGFSSVTSVNDAAVNTLASFIDPTVFAAYQSCLKLYAAGVRVTQTSGFGSKTVSVDLKYVPPSPGVKAFLTGLAISPSTAASCTLYRGDGVAPGPDPFKLELAPYLTYTVFCQLTAAAASANTLFTDVVISTSAGTAFHALLLNNPAPTSSEVVNRLTAVEIKASINDVRDKALEIPTGQSGVCCAYILSSTSAWQLVCNNPTYVPGALPFPAGTTVTAGTLINGVLGQCAGRFPTANLGGFKLPAAPVQLFKSPSGGRCAGQFNTFYQGLGADGSFVVQCTP